MLEDFPYSVLECGAIAERLLALDSTGTVRAVFERSFYLEFRGDQYVCVGGSDIGPGPLNVLLQPLFVGRTGVLWPSLNDLAEIKGEQLWLGRRPFACSLRAGRASQVGEPAQWNHDTVCVGLKGFERLAPRLETGEGLFGLCREQPDVRSLSSIERHALVSTLHIAETIAASVVGTRDNFQIDLISRLLGLGPGLTPSGDDFLAGALIALRFLRLNDALGSLWSIIASVMDERTHPISRSHLRAAAQGYCAPSVEAALRCLTEGDLLNLPAAVNGVTKLGHTSGWDILTGIVVALQGFASGSKLHRSQRELIVGCKNWGHLPTMAS